MMTKIFKTLAFAMLLFTACSREVINDENGFPLSATVNVTRQGNEAATKATYNDGTKKLSFSTGDKLFVEGEDKRAGGAGKFAGALDWVSGGTFSGTISTQNAYSGTADALFTAAAASVPAECRTVGEDDYRSGPPWLCIRHGR